jgi:hypothetical protein
LASHKVGRIGFGIEYEPGYVDVAIKRWQRSTKLEATLVGDDRSFEEISAARTEADGAPNQDQPLNTADHGAPTGARLRSGHE